MTALMLPLEHHTHALPCGHCNGTGVTGERYEMAVTGHVLLLEVFCPQCGGCGNGHPEHPGCQADWHPYPEDEGDWSAFDKDAEENDDGESACPSCGSGRGWYPIQGFTGEGDDAVMYILRGLCGCSEARLVPVETEAS